MSGSTADAHCWSYTRLTCAECSSQAVLYMWDRRVKTHYCVRCDAWTGYTPAHVPSKDWYALGLRSFSPTTPDPATVAGRQRAAWQRWNAKRRAAANG